MSLTGNRALELQVDPVYFCQLYIVPAPGYILLLKPAIFAFRMSGFGPLKLSKSKVAILTVFWKSSLSKVPFFLFESEQHISLNWLVFLKKGTINGCDNVPKEIRHAHWTVPYNRTSSEMTLCRGIRIRPSYSCSKCNAFAFICGSMKGKSLRNLTI